MLYSVDDILDGVYDRDDGQDQERACWNKGSREKGRETKGEGRPLPFTSVLGDLKDP